MHFSTHLKNNNNFLFKPLIKIIQVLFFFSLFYSRPHRAQALIISSSLISSHLSHQALISLLSPCLSLSLSLSHSLSSPSLNSGLKLIVNVAFAGLNVTDLSPDPRLCQSDPRRHRPPQVASHHRRPSLYSLCCD